MERKYIDAAVRILIALENGKVPITWHEMRRAELELEIAQELKRMDKEGNHEDYAGTDRD